MDCYRGSKVLVVGGAGFVGSNLVKQLLTHDPASVVVVDNLLSAEQSNIPADPRVSFIHASITNDDVLKSLENDYDYAFHLATFHGNQNSMHDPLADHENNTLTTLKLFERLKDMKSLKRVVYASAGCTVAKKTYGDVSPTTEEDPVSLHLDSPYQMSKIFGEFYANYYWQRHQLPVVKARFQNVYGPGEILGAGQWRGTIATIWRNVTPTFVYKALKHEALPLESGGESSRDFIYAPDICKGLLCCGANGDANGVYNLASGRETTIRELAELINEAAENPTPVQLLPRRNWDRSGKRFGSTDKAKETIGFEATTEIKDGIRQTVEWTKANLDMIEACMQRHNQNAKAAA